MIHDSFPLPDVGWADGAGFWAGARDGELRIPRCEACGTWIWYPKPACPACGSTAIMWAATSGTATLYTWSVVHHVFLDAYRDIVPYVTALAALDDDPRVRVATRVLADPAELASEMPLQATFQPLRFHDVPGEVVAPMFEPLRGQRTTQRS